MSSILFCSTSNFVYTFSFKRLPNIPIPFVPEPGDLNISLNIPFICAFFNSLRTKARPFAPRGLLLIILRVNSSSVSTYAPEVLPPKIGD